MPDLGDSLVLPSPLWLVVTGIAVGLGAAMPIGPVNVEMARRALRNGFRSGAALGCGAVTVDLLYSVLYGLGIEQFTRIPWVYQALAGSGVALLTYLGASSLRSAWRGRTQDLLESGPSPSLRSGYLTGVLMTATNPMTLAYWFSVLPGLSGGHQQSNQALPLIVVGVAIGTLAWVMVVSTLLAWAGRNRQPWWLRLADGAGGSIMLAMAGAALWRVARQAL